MELQEQTSLEDALAASYDKIVASETTEEPTQEIKEIPAEDAPEEASETAENPTETDAENTPEEEPVEAPASWTAEAKERFAQLPRETQEYIAEREAQREKAINQSKAELAEMRKSVSGIENVTNKHGQYLQSLGMSPDQAFDTLLTAEYTLRHGSPQQKMQMIQQLSRDYNIPLQLEGQDGNDYVAHLSQELNSVKSELSNLKSGQEEWRTQQGLQIIESFQNEKDEAGNPLHPFYADVETTMLGLIQSGLAKGLPDAYEKAIKIVPEVSQKLQAEEKKRADKINSEKAKKAKTEAPIKSRSLPKNMTAKSESEEDTLRRVYDELNG